MKPVLGVARDAARLVCRVVPAGNNPKKKPATPTEVKAKLKPARGIEPPTRGLRNRCSTPELRRHLKTVESGKLKVETPRPETDCYCSGFGEGRKARVVRCARKKSVRSQVDDRVDDDTDCEPH